MRVTNQKKKEKNCQKVKVHKNPLHKQFDMPACSKTRCVRTRDFTVIAIRVYLASL